MEELLIKRPKPQTTEDNGSNAIRLSETWSGLVRGASDAFDIAGPISLTRIPLVLRSMAFRALFRNNLGLLRDRLRSCKRASFG